MVVPKKLSRNYHGDRFDLSAFPQEPPISAWVRNGSTNGPHGFICRASIPTISIVLAMKVPKAAALSCRTGSAPRNGMRLFGGSGWETTAEHHKIHVTEERKHLAVIFSPRNSHQGSLSTPASPNLIFPVVQSAWLDGKFTSRKLRERQREYLVNPHFLSTSINVNPAD